MAALAERRSAADVLGKPLSGATILEAWSGQPTATGKRITEEGALAVGTVYACVRVIAETLASLPLPVYRRLEPRGKERAPNHPLYSILHDRPNEWMSSYTFRETLQGHLCLWGNAFAEIERSPNGRPVALWPLRPDRMEMPITSQAGTLIYRYCLPNGEKKDLPQANVLHIRGLSSGGLWGYSPVRLQREALGLALSAEEFQARFIGNSAQPSGILKVEGALSEDAAKRLKGSWEAAHRGLENAHRIAVLEEGVEWQAIGMPLQDAQFLELRQYQRAEIAGWFRVPPHMIGDVDRSTSWGSGIEQQVQGFITFTLRPWLVNWEQEANAALLTEADRRAYFIEHLIDGLLRGDSAARSGFYQIMLNSGAFSINDVRELENRNPIEGGDRHFVQQNMMPLDSVDDVLAAQQGGNGQSPPADQQDQQARDQEFDLQVGRIALNIQRFEELGEKVLAEMLRRQLREMYGIDPNTQPEPPPEPQPAEAPANQNSAAADTIEQRSLNARLGLRRDYQPLLKSAAQKVVEREVKAIREDGLPRLRSRALGDFTDWLEQHGQQDTVPYMRQVFAPIFAAYGAAVEREVLAELDIPRLTELLDPFIEQYAAGFAANYAERSTGQLRKVAREANEKNLSAEQAIQQRLAEWLEKRAGKIADTESVRAESAVAHQTYRRAGVQRLRWQVRGKNCPYCARLEGKTVGVAEAFANQGDELDGDEGQPKMRINRRTQHPPAHGSCNCGLVKA